MKIKILKFPEFCNGPVTKAGTHNLRYLLKTYDVVQADFSNTRVIDSGWLQWLSTMTNEATALGHKLIITDAQDYIVKLSRSVSFILMFE